jgi:class I fructose-bisphosphate aldolase
VVLWSYPRGQGVKNDTKRDSIAYAARVALELGADVAKVKYPGSTEAMEWTNRSAGDVDVVMSGGSRIGKREFLETVRAMLDAGGSGLAVGRNVWQRDDPEEMLDALEGVIFEDDSPDAALERTVA